MKLFKMNKFISFFTFNNVIAITLAPFGIYIKDIYLNNKSIVNHEMIHWKQQMEMLIIFFYLCYIIEFIIRLIINFFVWIVMIKNNSENTYDSFSELRRYVYMSISFEKEAYKNENNLDYLTYRKLYSWIKYLK